GHCKIELSLETASVEKARQRVGAGAFCEFSRFFQQAAVGFLKFLDFGKEHDSNRKRDDERQYEPYDDRDRVRLDTQVETDPRRDGYRNRGTYDGHDGGLLQNTSQWESHHHSPK